MGWRFGSRFGDGWWLMIDGHVLVIISVFLWEKEELDRDVGMVRVLTGLGKSQWASLEEWTWRRESLEAWTSVPLPRAGQPDHHGSLCLGEDFRRQYLWTTAVDSGITPKCIKVTIAQDRQHGKLHAVEKVLLNYWEGMNNQCQKAGCRQERRVATQR